jgi:hypothetical protein
VFTRVAAPLALLALCAGPAQGYIHFTPLTLPKMCKDSHHGRVLVLEKYDAGKGVMVFKAGEVLKGKGSKVNDFRFVLRADAPHAGPVRDWAAAGKTAVLFTIEGTNNATGKLLAIGYVFVDGYCFSADYSDAAKAWAVIRGEPDLSACYHGPADKLPALVKAGLAGEDVKVPTKEPAKKEDREQRNKEVDEVLKANRK